jgi:hypothetical protein
MQFKTSRFGVRFAAEFRVKQNADSIQAAHRAA